MTQVARFPLPVAYLDPAFRCCLSAAIDTLEFVSNFDRLFGTHLMHTPNRDDMHVFTEHVHDVFYMRLPDESIAALRASEGWDG